MPRVDGLYISSDFDTIKNDDVGSVSVTVPGGAVIAAGAFTSYTGTLLVGESNSMLVVLLTNPQDYPDGSYVQLTTSFRTPRTGGGGVPYDVYLRFSHISGGTVRVICDVWNGSASPLTLQAANDVYTFQVRTLKAPRFS